MSLLSLFRREPKPTPHDEAHKYAEDIFKFSKLRDAAFQRHLLQPNQENKERLKRLDDQIDIMQKTMLEFTDPR